MGGLCSIQRQEGHAYTVEINGEECCHCCVPVAVSHEPDVPSCTHCTSLAFQSGSSTGEDSILDSTCGTPPRPLEIGHHHGDIPIPKKDGTVPLFDGDTKSKNMEEEKKDGTQDKISLPSKLFNEEDFCPTCLEGYDADNPQITTKCGHCFHLGCILEWLERSNSCPVCSKEMEFSESD